MTKCILERLFFVTDAVPSGDDVSSAKHPRRGTARQVHAQYAASVAASAGWQTARPTTGTVRLLLSFATRRHRGVRGHANVWERCEVRAT